MIYKAISADAPTVARLAVQMWDEHVEAELADEFGMMLTESDCAIFLYMEEDTPVGFAQCQLRHDYVEGTENSPVGYLEGIFVEAEYRHRGIARALLAACESWAREMGCTEFASDCEIGNDASLAFHLKLGFAEANRIICFAKKL